MPKLESLNGNTVFILDTGEMKICNCEFKNAE